MVLMASAGSSFWAAARIPSTMGVSFTSGGIPLFQVTSALPRMAEAQEMVIRSMAS